MNRRAAQAMTLLATAAVAGGVPVDLGLGRTLDRQRRPKESIDDVLERAKRRRGKGWYDPGVDGRVK